MFFRIALFIAIIFLFPTEVYATKPCPAPICDSSKTCNEIATWVADGTIENIQHDKQKEPLNKNFAEFTFKIKNWIKPVSAPIDAKTINFKIGWCQNRRELPSETTGVFRFYGDNMVLDNQKNNQTSAQYLFFENLDQNQEDSSKHSFWSRFFTKR